MLKSKIKADNITTLTDARYFAAWGADWLGFNFTVGHENYVSPQVFQGIREWIEGPLVIGMFDLAEQEEVLSAVNMLNLDGVQLGMYSPSEVVVGLKGVVPLFRELVIEDFAELENLGKKMKESEAVFDYYVLNFQKNGLSWKGLLSHSEKYLNHLCKICENDKVFLQIDFPPSELDGLLSAVHPFGLNFTGGEEEKTGYKSFEDLDDLFEALEE